MSSTKKMWIAGVVIVILIIIVWMWYVASTPTAPTQPTLPSQLSVSSSVSTTSTSVSGTSTTTVPFSSEPYYSFAYQIYPKSSTQSPTQKQALSGFVISTKKNTNGSVVVTLTPTNSKFTTQHYTVLPTEKLYFVERMLSLKDDINNQDYFPTDDTAVIVDQAGNVVQ